VTLVRAAAISFVLGIVRPVEAQRIAPAGLTLRPRGISFVIERPQRVIPVVTRDSTAVSHRRATIIGGVVGAVVGGLAGTAIGINQNAYECVTIGPPCPRKPDHTLLYASTGFIVGGGLGAWLAHSLVALGR
jgi:hypothetical protein